MDAHTMYGKGPRPLLWAGLRTARSRILPALIIA